MVHNDRKLAPVTCVWVAGLGSVWVIGLTSARTELGPGARGTPFDITEASADNDIRRVMAEAMPGDTGWLPLDDPTFEQREVAYSSKEVVSVTSLALQSDVLIQYGLAHRMPNDRRVRHGRASF